MPKIEHAARRLRNLYWVIGKIDEIQPKEDAKTDLLGLNDENPIERHMAASRLGGALLPKKISIYEAEGIQEPELRQTVIQALSRTALYDRVVPV